jgi:hypothetical protein
LNFLDVTVSDFLTANNANIQHQFVSLSAIARLAIAGHEDRYKVTRDCAVLKSASCRLGP